MWTNSASRSYLIGPVVLLALATFFSSHAGAQGLNPSQRRASGQTPAKVLDGTAVFVRHYDPTQKLRLAIALTPPNPAEERQFLQDVQNKNSPLFHQYLSDDEWNARFAPSVADEQAIVDWAGTRNLTVTKRFRNRIVLGNVAGGVTVNKAESLPFIQLNQPDVHVFRIGQFSAKLAQGEFPKSFGCETLFEFFQKLVYGVHV